MSDTPIRIVVKVGSNVLTRPDGKPNVTNMSSLVDQIATLRSFGHEVILISSGAVACGRGAVQPLRQLDSVAQRQLFSSVGQIRLINLYNDLFASYGYVVGQVLTQKENFSSRSAYLNQRACMQTMLENGVIPIVNENDTASLTELMFTDNDELSGLIAAMMDADMLIILSNVDGIYTGSPADPDSRLIPKVATGRDLSEYVVAAKSGFGRGGMGTKCGIARKLSEEGVTVLIARGDRPNVLVDLIITPETTPHTEFEPRPEPISNIKLMLNWFKKKTLQRLQKSAAGFDAFLELPVVYRAMEICYERITGYKDVKFIYNLDTNEIDCCYTDKDGLQMSIPLSQLSDGFKSTVSLIADIAYRMASLNPQLGTSVLNETDGIVLIDEVDLHLHPAWQHRILGDLLEIFPKVQFIVTTHAPAVISSAKSEELVILKDHEAFDIGSESYGNDANSILKEIMGVPERNPAVAELFIKFYSFLDNKQYDEAEKILDEIDEQRDHHDKEVATNRVKLKLERIRGGKR